MVRILGIDPGSRITGYGVIDVVGTRACYVASGCIRVQGTDLASRLRLIFEEVRQIVDGYRPEQVAIERVFLHRNVDSALKLGHARGVALCAAALGSVPVTEYSAREIKQAVVGTGAAAKVQVQHMVRQLLGLDASPQSDAADALAVALCHSHTGATLLRLPLAGRVRRRGRRR
ncbi:MAG: crossover junction endodeoxyribonuclease RuvC [Gammaproteobacteria bacterium]|nr:crossover junction endodeoxyribonuclease RuvC [Gammaproteobacteria bacterium]